MKILLGYDPPVLNSNMLDRALSEAKTKEVTIYLVTSLYDGEEATPEEMDRVKRELDKIQAILQSNNIPSEQHILVRHLSPGEAIVTFAEENEVDEIWIQIKKLSRVGKMITGSNAQYIILHAGCPVVSLK